MKAYTDLEQSKKLAEILSSESADMCCFQNPNGDINYYGFPFLQGNKNSNPIPCWSLAALLSVLRKLVGYEVLCLDRKNITIKCELGDEPWSIEINKDNEVDACYEMIIYLNELKML